MAGKSRPQEEVIKDFIEVHGNKLPYNYETILEEIFENAKEASIREDDLKAKNRENKYLPSINFNGKQECFSKNPCTD